MVAVTPAVQLSLPAECCYGITGQYEDHTVSADKQIDHAKRFFAQGRSSTNHSHLINAPEVEPSRRRHAATRQGAGRILHEALQDRLRRTLK